MLFKLSLLAAVAFLLAMNCYGAFLINGSGSQSDTPNVFLTASLGD